MVERKYPVNLKKTKKWKLISRRPVYDGYPYLKVSIDKVQLPDGTIIDDYHRIEVHNAVMLLVENQNGQILVYNEYRHGVADLSYTLPAGGIEKNESIEQASRRELLEETGYGFKKCKLLKKYIVSSSYMFSEISFMQIKDIKKISESTSKDIENPEHIWLSKKELKEAVIENKFKALTYATAAMVWLLYNE